MNPVVSQSLWSRDKEATNATGCVYFLVLHIVDTVPASQVFKSDIYRFGSPPSSLWTLSLPVVVVVFVLCLGLGG